MGDFEKLLSNIKDKYKLESGSSSSVKTEQGGTFSSMLGEIKKKYYLDTTVDEAFVNSYFTDVSNFFTKAEADSQNVGYANAASAYDSRTADLADFKHRSRAISDFVEKNKGNMKQEDYDSITAQMKEINNALIGVDNGFREAKEYYAQWATEEDYNAAVKANKDAVEAYEIQQGYLNFDLVAGKAELEELYKKIKYDYPARQTELGNKMRSTSDENLKSQYYEQIMALDEELYELEQEYNRQTRYLNNASRIQEWAKLASVAENDDYLQMSGYVGTGNDLSKLTTNRSDVDYDALLYEYINNQNNAREILHAKFYGSEQVQKWYGKNYELMTPEETGIYNYYYNSGDKEQAQQYLDSIQETLNYRQAEKISASLEGKPVLQYAFAVGAGLDQFGSGVKSAIKGLFTDDNYLPVSATQYASGMVREDLGSPDKNITAGQVVYDFLNTGANMAPSILAAVLTKGLLSPALGAGAATVASTVGTTALGVSAGGTAYQQMLNQGYSKGQALTYGTMVGVSEATLEKLLGGIGALGGTSSTVQKLATSAVSKIDNALLRFSLKYSAQLVGQVGSEALEEGLQSVLEPIFQRAILHNDADIDWEEVAYSALLGGAMGGAFGGVDLGAEIKAEYNANISMGQKAKALENFEMDFQGVLAKALQLPQNTEAYHLAVAAQKKLAAGNELSDAEVGALYRETAMQVTGDNSSSGDSTAINTNPAQHTAQEQAVIGSDALGPVEQSFTALSDARKAAEAEFAFSQEARELGVTTQYDKMRGQIDRGGMAEGQDSFGRKFWIQSKSSGVFVAIVEGEGSGFVANELNKECPTFDEAYISIHEYLFEQNPDRYNVSQRAEEYDQSRGIIGNRAQITQVEGGNENGQAAGNEPVGAADLAAGQGDIGRAAVSDGERGGAAGAGAYEQAAPVAGRAGQPQRADGRRAARERQARNEALRNAVRDVLPRSPAKLGIPGGEQDATLKIVPVAYQTEEMKQVEAWFAERGISAYFFVGSLSIQKDGKNFAANGLLHGDRVFIRADSPNFDLEQIAEHEKFHLLKRENPGLVEQLMYELQEKYSPEAFKQIVDKYIKAYGSVVDMSREGAELRIWNEILADAYAGMNARGVDVAAYQEDVVQRVQKYTGEGRQAQSNGVRQTNGPNSQTVENEGGEFAIEYDVGNKPFVIVEEDILAGVPKKDWVRTVKNNLRNNFPNGIAIGNNTIQINAKSRREMTYSNYMQSLLRENPEIYGDKLRATNNADEILYATQNWVNEALLHPRNDAIIDFARGTVQIRVGENDYTAEVIVGNRGEGNLLLYDIINLTPTTIYEKKTGSDYTTKPQNEPSSRQSKPVSTNSISNSSENVNNEKWVPYYELTFQELVRAQIEGRYDNDTKMVLLETSESQAREQNRKNDVAENNVEQYNSNADSEYSLSNLNDNGENSVLQHKNESGELSDETRAQAGFAESENGILRNNRPGVDGYYDRENDRGVRVNSRTEWRNLPEGIQRRVINAVEDGISRSENYDEIRLVLAALIDKPVFEMTLKDKQTAITLLSQKMYSDMLIHRSVAEQHWGILGEDTGKIVSELYQISDEVNSQNDERSEFALGSDPMDADVDLEERMRHYANVPEYTPGMNRNIWVPQQELSFQDVLQAQVEGRYDPNTKMVLVETPNNQAAAEDADVDELLKWDQDINSRRQAAGTMRNVPKSEFEGTPHLRELGVQIENSVGDYWGVASAVANDKAAKAMKRQIKRAEIQLNPNEDEKLWARGIANGSNDLTKVPEGLDLEVIMELADYYAAGAALDIDLLREKRAKIAGGLFDTMVTIFRDSDAFSPSHPLIMNRRTPERNMLKIFGEKRGKEIYDALFSAVAVNEAERYRFMNRMFDEVRTFEDSNGKRRELTKEERAMVMLHIEGKAASEIAAGMEMAAAIQNAASNIAKGDDSGDAAREWGLGSEERRLAEQVAVWLEVKEAMDSGRIDAKLVEAASQKYSEMFNKFYDAINDFLVAHGYETIGFIKGYAPHIQPEKVQTTLNKVFHKMGIDADVGALPASIAGMTADFKPNKRYNPHMQHRRTIKTQYDIAKAYESYVEYMSDILYHTDDIMRIRQAANYFRRTYAPEEIKDMLEWAEEIHKTKRPEQMEAFLRAYGKMNGDSQLSANDLEDGFDEFVDEQYQKIANAGKYSEFVKYLENYANLLAGKQSAHDRGAEADGRDIMAAGNKLVRTFARSQVAGSISSALNQTAQLPQIIAEVGDVNVAQALWDIVSGKLKKAAWAQESDFLVGKEGIDFLVTEGGERMISWLFKPSSFVDGLISTIAVRGEYLKQVKAGKDHAEAMKLADKKGTAIMGSRMKGSKPVAFHAKSFHHSIINVFQIEALNSWEHLSQDLPRDFHEIAAEKGKKAAAGALANVLVKMILAAFVINRLDDELYGGTPAPFDVLGLTANFIASGEGLTTNQYLRMLFDNAWEEMTGERPFDTDASDLEGDFDWDAAKEDTAYNISNEIPFLRNLSALAGLGDDTLPLPNVGDAIDDIKNGKVAEGLFGLAADIIPGGRQIEKTAQGLETFIRGGKYSGYGDDKKLQYPVEQNAVNFIKAVLFGRSGLGQSEFYASGGQALSEKQTQTFEKLRSAGYDGAAIYEMFLSFRELKPKAGNKTVSNLQKCIEVAWSPWPEDMKSAMLESMMEESSYNKYKAALDAGVTTYEYFELMDGIDHLEPVGDNKGVVDLQKYMEVADTPWPEHMKAATLEAMMPGSSYEKYKTALDAGITTYWYFQFLNNIKDAKSDDSSTKKEKIVKEIHKMNFTSKQKDTLYLLQGYAESGLRDTPWH